MRIVSLILACLVITGHGRRVKAREQHQELLNSGGTRSAWTSAKAVDMYFVDSDGQAGDSSSFRALARLLLAFNSAGLLAQHIGMQGVSRDHPMEAHLLGRCRKTPRAPAPRQLLNMAVPDAAAIDAAITGAGSAATLAAEAIAPMAAAVVDFLATASVTPAPVVIGAVATVSAAADAGMDVALAAEASIGSMIWNVAIVGIVACAVTALRESIRGKALAETSYTHVARWPELKVFTFGEAAFSGKQSEKSLKFPGSRVVIRADPVPNFIGQIVGYHHPEIIPVLDLETNQQRDDNNVHFGAVNALFDRSSNHDSQRFSVSPPDSQVHDEQTSASGSFSMSSFQKVFTDSDWAQHDMTLYVLRSKELFMQKAGDFLAKTNYRMALLTKLIAYVDANVSNIEAALEILNAEMDPTKPQHHLYEKKLEHVMTFQFFTPTHFLSRALNPIGDLFMPQAPISSEGIAHNVHLLRDADNNGYLTFQGTTNLASWFDVNLAFDRYDPNKHATRFAANWDDVRWESIETACLHNCHIGFCAALHAFVSNEQFPLLAKRVADMRSLTVMGHSFGGSLASMFAMSAHAVKDLQKVSQLLDEVRSMPNLESWWPLLGGKRGPHMAHRLST
mmetsp:Transcript_103897/g.170940  ORF Transcript_103897/g.170940 Transcript_103897/m.170940 type:complete len:620 (-) Transcript_103897:211-2070(-)